MSRLQPDNMMRIVDTSRIEIQWTMALLQIEVWETTASTFYEKLFSKLLYLRRCVQLFFFLHPFATMSWGIKVNVELNVSLVWF